MKARFGHFKALLCFVVALVCALTLFACNKPTQNGEPTPPPQTKPEPPVKQLREVDLTEFLAQVYNRNAPNFTLDAAVSDGGENQAFKFVYDAKVGYCAEYEGGETVYSDGFLYRKAADDSNGAEWYATESDAFFEFKTIKQRNLEAILELLLPYIGIDTETEVAAVGEEYVLKIKKDYTEVVNALLAIAKKDIDEKAIVGVTEAWNYLRGSSLTPEEFEREFVFYGDSTFNELLKEGKPIREETLAATYATISLLLYESYRLPSYNELKSMYGDLSLSALIGKRSAREVADLWKEETLRERLQNYPYTDGTVADFVASDAPTKFTKAETSAELSTDASFALTTATFTQTVQAKDAPVFSASLNGDGIKTEIKDYAREIRTECKFSHIGVSVVKVPEKFAVVGEEHLTVNRAGKYAIKRGNANRPVRNISVAAYGGDGVGEDLDDSKQWVELLKQIAEGLKLDDEGGTLTVSADGYKSMKRAVSEGLTALRVRAYEEFYFLFKVE